MYLRVLYSLFQFHAIIHPTRVLEHSNVCHIWTAETIIHEHVRGSFIATSSLWCQAPQALDEIISHHKDLIIITTQTDIYADLHLRRLMSTQTGIEQYGLLLRVTIQFQGCHSQDCHGGAATSPCKLSSTPGSRTVLSSPVDA